MCVLKCYVLPEKTAFNKRLRIKRCLFSVSYACFINVDFNDHECLL